MSGSIRMPRTRRRSRTGRAWLACAAALLASLSLSIPSAVAASPTRPDGPELFGSAQQSTETARSAQQAAAVPAKFSDDSVLTGLNQPVDVAFAKNGRVFVAEKSGVIKVFDSIADPTPTIFADLRAKVHNFWDRGLLGIALHPDFPTNPSVYVMYAHDARPGGSAPYWGNATALDDDCPSPPGAQAKGCLITGRISKLTATGDTAGPEQVLVEGWCQQFPSHATGSLAFGPDGYLYASAGDGASFDWADYGQTPASGAIPGKDPIPANPCGDGPSPVGTVLTAPTAEGGALRAQDFRTPGDPYALNGSVIRIDANTGAGAPGNPLAANPDANARRLVAAGLRNPFRIGFRPGTNELWVGDVGWSTWEELDRFTPSSAAVANFGWPCYEGSARQGGYESIGLNLCADLYAAGPGAVQTPYYAYDHGAPVTPGDGCPTGNGSAVSGVTFYTGQRYPAAYRNALFFADHSRRCIWSMTAGADGQPDPATRKAFATSVNVVQVLTGPEGDVYYVGFEDGAIHRIRYTGSAPTAVATATPTTGTTPLTVAFTGSASFDPDPGESLTYAWDLDGDGAFDDSTAANPTYTYTTPGTRVAKLRVTDPVGLTDDSDPITVSAGNAPPIPVIDSPASTLTWKVGDPIAFSGHATDPQDGTIPGSGLNWQIVMHHCTTPTSCHEHQITGQGGASGTFTAVDHEYPSWLELRLTATDSGGLSAVKSLRLDPRTVDVTLASNPPGLTLGLFSAQRPAPFTNTVIVGGTSSIAAPSPQTLGGKTYEFLSWSDGGAAAHNITAPATALTVTATYREVTGGPTGPVARYGFDANSGTVVADSSGKGNNGTVAGGTWVAGHSGNALSFNGTSSMVTVPHSSTLALTAGMTLEAWVKPAAVTDWRTIMLKERGGGLSYALYANGTNAPNTSINTSGGNDDTYADGTTPLSTTAWSHVAATYDGTTLRLYVNGVQVHATAHTGPIVDAGGALRIGGNGVWGEYFTGLIDDVRVYDRALSPTELTTDMNTPVG
ncbi:LamG-like jellyroll fold domain-containing protein [Streptomyces sp. SID3343]|uniref:LamG-like jellyroll fold domain-containing protein n=1 Tax=Streptomyces sp. SID3343 TaxID=2690260 RepID=UPI001F2B56E1|nr:LamG-like jellyroll fold domain-containing protein [Streptomyces sp. SID3343]